MAAGASVNTCGDTAPTGWIATAVSGNYCAKLGSTYYIARTIKQLDGLATNATATVCGDIPPAGWITTDVQESYCNQLASTYYIGRMIRRIAGLPIGAKVDICGDKVPVGWVSATTQTKTCARLGKTSYTGRTIQKVSNSAGAIATLFAEDATPPGFLAVRRARAGGHDFDGDGKADAVTFARGVWQWQNSSDDSVETLQFGHDGDAIAPSDYDGDGRTDFAVARRDGETMQFDILPTESAA
jgi:hypothetical protein